MWAIFAQNHESFDGNSENFALVLVWILLKVEKIVWLLESRPTLQRVRQIKSSHGMLGEKMPKLKLLLFNEDSEHWETSRMQSWSQNSKHRSAIIALIHQVFGMINYSSSIWDDELFINFLGWHIIYVSFIFCILCILLDPKSGCKSKMRWQYL